METVAKVLRQAVAATLYPETAVAPVAGEMAVTVVAPVAEKAVVATVAPATEVPIAEAAEKHRALLSENDSGSRR
jgi:hypothetical protein